MQEANCIADATRIVAGQVIYVPPAFYRTTSSSGSSGGSSTSTESSIPRQLGCTVQGIAISYPAPGAVLTRRFDVRGSAILPEDIFQFYKVEIRREGEDLFRNAHQSDTPVSGGTLATLNPADFGAGHYQLVLTVVDVTGNFPEPCAIRVTFR